MRPEAGFTIIEGMIAMVVISIGLLALGSFTLSVLSADSLARERIVATHIAEQMLEEWAATNDLASFGTTPPSVPTTSGTTNSTTVGYTPSTVNVQYTLTVSVARMVAPLPDGLGGVSDGVLTGTPTPVEKKVAVSWTHKGNPYTVYLTHVTIKQ